MSSLHSLSAGIVRFALLAPLIMGGLGGCAQTVKLASVQKSEDVHKRALVGLSGAASKVTQASIELVRTEEEWVKVWQRHRGEKPTGKTMFLYNPMGVPVVDFERCLVLVIFGGDRWNTAGYAIHSISERSGSVLVRYDDKSYQTAGPDGGGQKATPYGFFVLPRTERAMTLEKNVQSLIGQPPKWQETASFPAS